jgi:hypothetical protein
MLYTTNLFKKFIHLISMASLSIIYFLIDFFNSQLKGKKWRSEKKILIKFVMMVDDNDY